MIWFVAAIFSLLSCCSGVRGGLDAVKASRQRREASKQASVSQASARNISHAVESDRRIDSQREVVVVLNQRTTTRGLEQIAQELYASAKPQRTQIIFRLAAIEYAPMQRPWAIARFAPVLELELIGLSSDQADALATLKPDQTAESVGQWLDDEARHKIHIYRERDDYVIERYDLSGAKRISRPRVEEDERGRLLYDEQDPDHYLLITAFHYKLELHRHEPEGLVRRMERLSNL